MQVARFQIWLVELNPTKGQEINKTRPCLIVSPDELAVLGTVIVAPMTQAKGLHILVVCRVILRARMG